MNFTIVVPTYNVSKYIRPCLESIFSQKHDGNTEVLVIDNQSIDNTTAIANEYPCKVYSDKDKGEPDAINKGMKLATGDIVAWLDADDVYEPDCFSVVEWFFELKKPEWAYGKCRFINEDGKEIRRLLTSAKQYLQRDYSYNKLCNLCFISQPSVFMLRSFRDKLGDCNINNRLIFDYEYWLRAGKLAEPGFIPHYLSAMRAHGGSMSVQYDRKQMLDSLKVVSSYNHHYRLTYGIRVCVLAATITYYRTIGRVL